jgi:SH3 domain protein
VILHSIGIALQRSSTLDLSLMLKRQQKSIHRYIRSATSLALAALTALSLQLCLATFHPSPLKAESQYVIPSSEIPVRRGQANDYKIVALVSDGTKVEVIERGDSYSLIRLENGKEGWILTRFLSDDPPLTEVVEALTSENEAIKLKEQQSTQERVMQEQQSAQKQEELSQALAQIEQKLATTAAQRDAINASFEKLKKDTANVVEIKQKMANTLVENKSFKQKLSSLTRENEELKSDDRLNWFLAGGGVLLLGIIIGKITTRSRKRKPSLM